MLRHAWVGQGRLLGDVRVDTHSQPTLKGLWVVLRGAHALILAIKQDDCLVAHVEERDSTTTVGIALGGTAVLHEHQQDVGWCVGAERDTSVTAAQLLQQ